MVVSYRVEPIDVTSHPPVHFFVDFFVHSWQSSLIIGAVLTIKFDLVNKNAPRQGDREI
jgi:hypothetical protein